jgi:hypothetical protein
MKHTTLPIVIALLALLVLTPAYAALQPSIVVSSFQIKDGEAAIGKTFTLEVTLMNNEPSACAQAITTTLQAGPPFIMDGISTVSAGDLCYGARKTVDFPMKIDPSASGGFYQLTLSSTYETSLLAQYSNSNTINLFVQGSPSLDASIISSAPVDVYPGDTATITIAVQNNGGFEAQSVNANLVAPNTPLDVKWAGANAPLGLIDAKQTKTAQFSVEVPKDAAAKDYPMTLRLRYLDENLASQSVDAPLVFHVRQRAQFETADAGSNTLYANDNSRIVELDFKNTGTDTARKIKIKIQPQFPFSTDGSVRYIDTLAPGQSAPIQFVVNVDKDGTVGAYGLDAIVDFEDAQGKKLQDTATVSLTVEDKSILRAIFIDYWFAWLVVVIAFVIVMRKRQTAKKSKKD